MKDRFVGRTEELARILTTLASGPERLLLSVEGDGGVGKTTLVNEAVRQVLVREDSHRVAAVVDFDLPHNHTVFSIKRAIAKAYRGGYFESYMRELDEMEKIESLHLPDEAREILENAKHREERCFREALQKQHDLNSPRLLLVLDTVEKVQATAFFDQALRLVAALNNVLVLVAGRRNQEIHTQLHRVFGDTAFDTLRVEPLDEEATNEYLSQVLAEDLGSETGKKLWLLTQGKPILLDLTATWIKRTEVFKPETQLPGAEILARSLDEIHTNLDAVRNEFEKQTVVGIRQLNTPLEWAILYMALMEHPCTPELWQTLLDLDSSRASWLMKDLRDFFFVRKDDTLHDEMRELLRRHAWPNVDRNGTLQRGVIRRLLEYSISRKADIKGWDSFVRNAEELHYRLLLDTDDGCRYFINEFNSSLKLGWDRSCQLLLQTIMGTAHWSRLSSGQRDLVEVREGQLFNERGQEDLMEVKVRRILIDPDSSPAAKADAYCTIAFGQRDVSPEESAANYENALAIVKTSGDRVAEARILNWAAQSYRRIGQMGKAVEYFDACIEQCDAIGDLSLMASAQNNLAYVYRQLGEVDRALTLARLAHVQREELNDLLGLAYSHQTIGEIYRDMSLLLEAEQQFLASRQIFSQFDTAEINLGYVNIALANLHRKRDNESAVERYLEEALAIFDRRNSDEGRTQAWNEYGCEYRRRGRLSTRRGDYLLAEEQFSQAEKYFDDSVELSKKMKNWYRLADSLADLCLLYRYWFQNCSDADKNSSETLSIKAQDVGHEAMMIARRHGFVLIENRAIEALGDLTYYQGKYFKAFAMYYIQACLDMARYYGSALWRYNLVFNRVHRRLINPHIDAMDTDEVRYIAAYMVRRWREEGKDQIAPGFVAVYEEVAKRWRTGVRR